MYQLKARQTLSDPSSLSLLIMGPRLQLNPHCYCGQYYYALEGKSYCDLEWPSVHYDLLPHIKVLHSVEQVILWSRLVDAVTTNKGT